MLVFIKLLQEMPGRYLIQDHARNKAMRCELPHVFAGARNSAEWREDDAILKSVSEFLFPGGPQAVQTVAGDKAEKPKKKSRGKNKGKGKVKGEDKDAARCMEEVFGTPKIIVGNIRLSNIIRQNPLLAALAEPMPGVYLIDSSELKLEADTTDEVSCLAADLAHIDDDDNEDAASVADFGDEVANLTHALDALEMIHARGEVVLEEGDEFTFEQATQQQGPQGATSGVEEDVEMVM